MNTNVASFFYMTQQVIPQMRKQNSGHVVCISGASADQPRGAATELLAVLSKSPLAAASKALALECAANNIRFNTVSPAVVNTPMHTKAKSARNNEVRRCDKRLITARPTAAGCLCLPWILPPRIFVVFEL